MNRRFLLITVLLVLAGCNLAPDFELPDLHLPSSFKEAPAKSNADLPEEKANWKQGEPLEKADRGNWWKIFSDEQLNELEKQAQDANPSLQSAAARVEQSRAIARAYDSYFLPNVSIGANALRAQPANASVAAFGVPATKLKPYTMYQGSGVISYEADLFGSIRNNAHAFEADADAENAAYRSALLALQADVAQHYFAMRALDSERQLLRDTIAIRDEAMRIMQHKFDVGAAGEQDLTRTTSDLASSKADQVSVDRQRAELEHAMAVLLGKTPSEFTFAESPLTDVPPAIPAGLPSSLLERRPDIASAQSTMAAANARIGVARAAFFPSINLTASGGFESLALSDLFKWSSRTWALGQVAGTAITMPIFDNGYNMGQLDAAHAAYNESLANYREQVLVAFRDVEDSLSGQRLLSEQSIQQDAAAAASTRTMEVVKMRYKEGDTDFFEVVNTQRDSLAAERAAVQIRGQRFTTTIALIRALGGGWDESTIAPSPEPIPKDIPVTDNKQPDITPTAPAAPLVTPPATVAPAPEANVSPVI